MIKKEKYVLNVQREKLAQNIGISLIKFKY